MEYTSVVDGIQMSVDGVQRRHVLLTQAVEHAVYHGAAVLKNLDGSGRGVVRRPGAQGIHDTGIVQHAAVGHGTVEPRGVQPVADLLQQLRLLRQPLQQAHSQ